MSSRRYTPEFRAEAIRQVTDRGYPVSEVSRRPGFRAFCSVRSPIVRHADLDTSLGTVTRCIRTLNRDRVDPPIPLARAFRPEFEFEIS